jgi:hypothetical protein
MTWAKDYYKRNREEILKKVRAYQKNNPEKMKEARRKWHEANREKELARMKLFWLKNKKMYNARRRKPPGKILPTPPIPQPPTLNQNEQHNHSI